MGIFDNFNSRKRENENIDDFMDVGNGDTNIWTDESDDMSPIVEEEPRNARGFGGINESAVSLKLVAPKGLSDAAKIADYLIAGCSVVLNIEDIEKIPDENVVVRFMDYLQGVLYVIQGNMKQVSKTTFVATPNNVGIDSEDNNAD